MTEKETSILRYLYRVGQRPVSRETLLQEVWGYNSGVCSHRTIGHAQGFPRAAMNSRGERYPRALCGCTSL